MMATVTESGVVAGVYVVEPTVWRDERGFFLESWRHEWIPGAAPMVQGNHAERRSGTVVGLHFHRRQADYWYVPRGRVFVALHDLRSGSPTEGNTLTLEIGEHDRRGVYIPAGVAHGFCTLTDATVTYLVDRYYDPDDELGVAWDDPDVGVGWPVAEPELSERDRSNPRRADVRV